MTSAQQECIEMLKTICLNAKLIPDPSMEGLTDCWAIPLDDIIAATVLLANAGIGPYEEKEPNNA